ncbi:hypothetical protein [Rhizomonospora bruguierae]|uniref:hypothetical protein n=1 Tax=Rhizomonospora bruguierae TaxID=1581705 RepID=UPI001BCCBE1B|nr:hypothetical protein [Micromonospora sp. NBRC 107566]
MSARWAGVPFPVRFAVGAAVVVFAYGTGAHVTHIVVGGLNPYPSMPPWLAAYFVSLTVLDPLAAWLLLLRRLEGLVLGALVLLTDALANGYANYVLDHAPGVTAGRIGQGVIAALAVAILATVPWLAPWLRRPH